MLGTAWRVLLEAGRVERMSKGKSGEVNIVEGTLTKPRLAPEAGGASELSREAPRRLPGPLPARRGAPLKLGAPTPGAAHAPCLETETT